MANFTFSGYDSDAHSNTTKEFTTDHLDTVLHEFQYFLKGIGFEFNGNIELVQHDDLDLTNFQVDGGSDFGYDVSIGDSNG